ncbi:MAG: ABC transporter ATP-binding protein [Candidatus Dormibacteraeota bacterium]|nr:ABC transporter ATP-binding protein [Candidatus Dormibacteraeota bacterium]
MTPAIVVRNLTKRFRIPVDRSTTLKYRLSHPVSTARYRDLLAVDDVSFEVAPSQFLGVIGSNGSGKSTLLKILAGIYRATSGSVSVNGLVSPFLELGVGFNPELTARENVFVNGAVLGLSRPELTRRMEGILHFADLEDFADQKLKNFSSGMQVRLAFTVAIQADAAVLLMDEVLAVGDARFQAKCFDVFARYKREGKTVVLVTHDLSGVDMHCDRAILLDHGRIIKEGAANDVTATYRQRSGEDASDDAAESMLAEEESGGSDTAQNRWGNGAVRFRSIAVDGGAGERGLHFQTGSPLRLRLELQARDPLDDLVVGFSIHRPDGMQLSGTNTQLERLQVPKLDAGECLSLAYSVEQLALLDGVYRLDVAAVSGSTSTTFEWIQNAARFSVTDVVGRSGIFHLRGAWEPPVSAPITVGRLREAGG